MYVSRLKKNLWTGILMCRFWLKSEVKVIPNGQINMYESPGNWARSPAEFMECRGSTPPHSQPQERGLFAVAGKERLHALRALHAFIWNQKAMAGDETVLRILGAINHLPEWVTWQDSKPRRFLTSTALLQCFVGILSERAFLNCDESI